MLEKQNEGINNQLPERAANLREDVAGNLQQETENLQLQSESANQQETENLQLQSESANQQEAENLQLQPEPADPQQEAESPLEPVQTGPGFVDLIYGALFSPGRTFAKFNTDPPVLYSILNFTVVTLLTSLTALFTFTNTSLAGADPLLENVISTLRSLFPLFILFGLFLAYLKLITYSGVLHLLAELFGGEGKAKTVLSVYGFAVLPAIFNIPAEILALFLNLPAALENILLMGVRLLTGIWTFIILLYGIKEVQRVSSLKAAVILAAPWVVFVLLLVGLLTALVLSAASLIPQLQ